MSKNSYKNASPTHGAAGQAKGSSRNSGAKPAHGATGQAKGSVSSKPRFGAPGQKGATSSRSAAATRPNVAD